MNSRMLSAALATVLCAVPAAAFAEADINLAAELPGKACLGGFSIPHPKGNRTDQGAVRISFANGTAAMVSVFGLDAYRAPAAAKFDALEPVVSVQMTGNRVTLVRKTSDWKLTAIRREGPAIVLSGEADPRRGNPTWVPAMASVSCQ